MTLFRLLFALLFILMSSVTKADDKPLVLVMGEDSYPFQFVDDEGKPQGLLVELWHEWARVNRRKVEFVPKVWHESIDQLAQRRADVHIGMALNNSRERQFDFAAPISNVSTYVYLHKDLSARTSLEQLSPFPIGIVSGATFEHELGSLVPNIIFKQYPTRESLLGAAYRGDVVAFAGMEGYLRDQVLQQQLSGIFPIENRILVRQAELHPAVAKGNDLLRQQIEQGFANIPAETIKDIERHWLGYQREQSGLDIAMQLGVEPYVDVGIDGSPYGLYVDIWRLWSHKTGIPINFIPSNMNSSLVDVRSGKADVHIGYPENDDVKSGLYRAKRIYSVKSRLFLYGKQSADLSLLKGKRLGVFPTAPYVSKVKAALPDTELRFYQGMDEMLSAVRSGDVVGFVAAGAWAQHYLLLNKSWGDFVQVPELEYSTDVFALIRNGDEGLAKRISSGFNMIAPHELAEIEQKWILNSRDHVFTNVEGQLELSTSEQKYIQNLGTLKFGYLEQWAPMEFMDASGQFAGVNSDITAMMHNMLGIRLEPVPFKEWSELIAAVKNGQIDIAGSVAKNPERAGTMGFSEPYWPSPWALLSQMDDVSIFNLGQIEGRRLAVVEGYQLVGKLMAEHPSIKLILVPDSQAGIEAVLSGKADLFVDKVVTLANQLRSGNHPQLKLSTIADFSDQHSHFAVNLRHNELLPLLNMVIAKLNPARVQEIALRWVNLSAEEGEPRYQSYLKYALLALASVLIVLAMVGWFVRLLRAEKTALKQAQARTEYLTSHDPLTALPNRLRFDGILEQAVITHRRAKSKFALLLINLDGFKKVNDQFGYGVGDKFLIDVAAMLKDSLNKVDTVARFSGDEFVVLLENVVDGDVYLVAENMITTLSQPQVIGADTVRISASIGIALFPTDGDSPIALLKKADSLMRLAKQTGGHGYRSA